MSLCTLYTEFFFIYYEYIWLNAAQIYTTVLYITYYKYLLNTLHTTLYIYTYYTRSTTRYFTSTISQSIFWVLFLQYVHTSVRLLQDLYFVELTCPLKNRSHGFATSPRATLQVSLLIISYCIKLFIKVCYNNYISRQEIRYFKYNLVY